MSFSRYAIYFMPDGAFAAFGAQWLGWDPQTEIEGSGLAIKGLPLTREILTKAPRKYGLHATLKAPFRLADGKTEARLISHFNAFCKTHKPAVAGQLQVSHAGGFLSLRPTCPLEGLNQLAADCVTAFDGFRRALSPQELARRRKANLSVEQERLLQKWGYPYVMSEFHFHITLTGRINHQTAEQISKALRPSVQPFLTDPFKVNELCLAAERADGRFCILCRSRLSG